MSESARIRCLVLFGSDQGYDFSANQMNPRSPGTSSIHHQIDRQLIDVTQTMLCPLTSGQVLDLRYGPVDVILNTISDSDVNPETLAMAETICNSGGLPVINHPRHIWATTREGVSELLRDVAEFVVPGTVRLSAGSRDQVLIDLKSSGLQWPLLWRPAGSHTGKGLERFETLEDAEAWIKSNYADGEQLSSDHILTEFVDFQSADGLYRKIRIYCIGGKILFRHHMVAETWNVHSTSQIDENPGNEHLMDEGLKLLNDLASGLGEPVMAALGNMNALMQLDYFGVDAALLDDGRLLIFEANPNMDLRAIDATDVANRIDEETTTSIAATFNEVILGAVSP